MADILMRFLDDDSGAVSVDWIVLTAAVVGLSAINFVAIESSSNDLMDAAGQAIAAQDDFGAAE